MQKRALRLQGSPFSEYMYTFVYIYIYRERERSISIYIYIYTYIHTYIHTDIRVARSGTRKTPEAEKTPDTENVKFLVC